MDGERDQVAGGDQADGVDQAGPGMQAALPAEKVAGSMLHYAVADEQDGEHGQFGKMKNHTAMSPGRCRPRAA